MTTPDDPTQRRGNAHPCARCVCGETWRAALSHPRGVARAFTRGRSIAHSGAACRAARALGRSRDGEGMRAGLPTLGPPAAAAQRRPCRERVLCGSTCAELRVWSALLHLCCTSAAPTERPARAATAGLRHDDSAPNASDIAGEFLDSCDMTLVRTQRSRRPSSSPCPRTEHRSGRGAAALLHDRLCGFVLRKSQPLCRPRAC